MKLSGWIGCGSIAIGLLIASGICLIALDHNPQGEFYSPENGGLQWDSLLPLFLSWAAPVAIISFGISIIVALAFRGLRAAVRNRRPSKPHSTLIPPRPPCP
jgi:hypothetical protein